MASKGIESDAIQWRLVVRILVDVVGCIIASGFVIKPFFHKKIKLQRKNNSKAVFADISRQSSFSSLHGTEVGFSITQDSEKNKSQNKINKANVTETDNHPLNTSLESLSIVDGEPPKKGSEPVTEVNKGRRPLISPAKFTVGDSIRQRKILIPDIDTPISVSLASSRASSVHGSVYSTVTDADKRVKTKGSVQNNKQEKNCSPFMYVLFGISLGINVTIVIAAILWSVLFHKT